MKTNRNRKIIISVYAGFFLLMLFLAWCTPLAGDDYIYAFNDNSPVRPVRIIDIVRNIRIQRVTTSARFISHFFVEYFIMEGKWIFDLVNAAVNTAALALLFGFARGEGPVRKKHVFLLPGAVFLLWCFVPVFGEVYLWLDGACNYSWAAALLLLFITPFFKIYTAPDYSLSAAKKVLWLLLCPVFGAYSENGSAAGLIIAFLLLLFTYFGEKEQRKKLLFPAAGFALGCAGYLFLISSPVIMDKGDISGGALSGIFSKVAGLFAKLAGIIPLPVLLAGTAAAALFLAFAVTVLKRRKGLKYLNALVILAWLAAAAYFALRALRAAEMPSSGNAAKAALAGMGTLKGAFMAVLSEPVENLLALCAIFAVVFFTGIYYRVRPKILWSAAVFAAAGLASVAVFLLAIYQPARSCCYFALLLIAGALMILSELAEQGGGKLLNAAGTALAVIFAVCLIVGVGDNISVKRQDRVIQERIAYAQQAGETKIALPPYRYLTKYSALYGIDNIATEYCWLNHFMGMYYGFDELIGIEE